MNIKKLFPSKWLSPDDLAGRRVEVQISGCAMEEVRNPQTNQTEQKLVIAFAKATKRLIVNKTQAFDIAEITGGYETDEWIGHRVALCVGRARNGKDTIVIEAASVQAPTPHLDADGEDTKEVHY